MRIINGPLKPTNFQVALEGSREKYFGGGIPATARILGRDPATTLRGPLTKAGTSPSHFSRGKTQVKCGGISRRAEGAAPAGKRTNCSPGVSNLFSRFANSWLISRNRDASANLMSAFVFDIVTLDAEFICCNLRGRVLNKFRFDEFRSKPQRRLRGLQVRRDRADRYRKRPRIPRNMRIFSGDPLKKLRNECRSVTDNVSGVITRNRKRSEQILFQIWSGERAQCCKVGERVWLEFHRIFSTTMHQSDWPGPAVNSQFY